MSRIDLRMKPLGLTRAQWQVWPALFQQRNPQSELSDELGCEDGWWACSIGRRARSSAGLTHGPAGKCVSPCPR
jgi:hypothetical protein